MLKHIFGVPRFFPSCGPENSLEDTLPHSPCLEHLDVLGVGSLQLLPEVPICLQHINDLLEVPVVVQACVLRDKGRHSDTCLSF